MAVLRTTAVAALITGGVLLGAVACGGSSTVTAPTAPELGGTSSETGDAGGAAGPTSLPATAPDSAQAPAITDADRDFIAAIRDLGITAPDDVVLTAGQFVCASDQTNPQSESLEPIITGSISPWVSDPAQAAGTAEEFITAARSGYCEE